MIRIRTIIIFTVLLTALHLSAIFSGLYQGKVWVDIPLHITGGALLGLFWVWILELPLARQKFGLPSKMFIGFSIISFALFGSFLWEVWEFLFSTFASGPALFLKIYSFTVSDTLSDMFFGMIGGIAVAIFLYKKVDIFVLTAL